MIVLSDLHVDQGDGDFTPNAAKFNDFLDYFSDQDILINGDFLDAWLWSITKILDGPHKKLLFRIRDMKNIALNVGNHDPDLELMQYIFQKNIFNYIDYAGWHILHGHILDYRLDTPQERWAAKTSLRIIEFLRNPLLFRFARWINSSKHENSYLKDAIIKSEYIAVYKRWLCGHTHSPINDIWYVNEGSWCSTVCMYCILQSNGTIEVKSWE
jgi:hypothetical protein